MSEMALSFLLCNLYAMRGEIFLLTMEARVAPVQALKIEVHPKMLPEGPEGGLAICLGFFV